MILISFILSYFVTIIIADRCDVCLQSKCHAQIILLQNVDISDQLAMDWTNNILYVQLHSVVNTAFHIEDYSIKKMHVVQIAETSGMVVRQDTQDLYTAGTNKKIYRIKKGTNDPEIDTTGILDGAVNFMFYRNRLYLTKKDTKNIFYFDNATLIAARDLWNFTITDFVKTERGVHFVSNNIVYEYRRPFNKPPKPVTAIKMVLSMDKDENVYFASEEQRVIYKRNNVTNKLFVFAAYKRGRLDKFVFDRDFNVIAYDAKAKNLVIWKEEPTTCTIVLPHCKVQINVHKSDNIIEEEDDDIEEGNDNVVYDFFWKQSEKLADRR